MPPTPLAIRGTSSTAYPNHVSTSNAAPFSPGPGMPSSGLEANTRWPKRRASDVGGDNTAPAQRCAGQELRSVALLDPLERSHLFAAHRPALAQHVERSPGGAGVEDQDLLAHRWHGADQRGELGGRERVAAADFGVGELEAAGV